MQSLSNLFGWREEEKNPSPRNLRVRNEVSRRASRSHGDIHLEDKEGEDVWGKLQKIFFNTDAEETNKQSKGTEYSKISGRNKTYSGSGSLLAPPKSKPPLLRTESVPSHDKRNSVSSCGSVKRMDKFRLASSYIPDAFKQSFDLSFEVEDELPNAKLGTLEFSTIYLFEENILFVKILKAKDLPAMDLCGTSDPFVKCCLLPDRKRKLETKIRRKTLNPVWNEVLSFEGLAYEKIKQRVLYLQIYDYDRFSRNDPIGEIYLPLHTIDLSRETLTQSALQPCEKNKRGELLLSLCYQPIEGVLNLGVVQGRNMKSMDLNGTSDPYVKIWVLHRGKKIEKKKTATLKNTLNPNFHQNFSFEIPMVKLRDTQFEITVMDYDVIGRNDTIGKIYLGHKSTGLEKQHWKDMLASTRKAVYQWHVLKI